jgi:hypothetical protein
MSKDLYYDKYIKYKMKYINIKTLIGGNIPDENNIKNELYDEMIEFINKYKKDNEDKSDEELFKWDIIKTKDNDKLLWYFNFRKAVVDELIKLLFKKYKCEETCTNAASGSVGTDANLKSDYDLTIVNPDYYTSTIIRIFNHVIEKIFGDQPAIVFDTNLYGYSGMIPTSIKNININKEIWEEDIINKKYYVLNINHNDKDIIDSQLNWALLRLETHGYKLLTTIDTLQAWKEQKFIENINDKTEKQLNDLYVSRMKILEHYLKDTESDINKTKAKIIDNLSYMNYYGNETYFTLGAFKHVVGTMFYYREQFK